jgi:hypothetical protein
VASAGCNSRKIRVGGKIWRLGAGGVTRSNHQLPKQGDHGPWRVPQNYLRDLWGLRFASLKDGALSFK